MSYNSYCKSNNFDFSCDTMNSSWHLMVSTVVFYFFDHLNFLVCFFKTSKGINAYSTKYLKPKYNNGVKLSVADTHIKNGDD